MLMLAIHDISRNVIKYVFSLGYYDFHRHDEDVTLMYAGCDITPLIKSLSHFRTFKVHYVQSPHPHLSPIPVRVHVPSLNHMFRETEKSKTNYSHGQ